jgi:hypothetical protein
MLCAIGPGGAGVSLLQARATLVPHARVTGLM